MPNAQYLYMCVWWWSAMILDPVSVCIRLSNVLFLCHSQEQTLLKCACVLTCVPVYMRACVCMRMCMCSNVLSLSFTRPNASEVFVCVLIRLCACLSVCACARACARGSVHEAGKVFKHTFFVLHKTKRFGSGNCWAEKSQKSKTSNLLWIKKKQTFSK